MDAIHLLMDLPIPFALGKHYPNDHTSLSANTVRILLAGCCAVKASNTFFSALFVATQAGVVEPVTVAVALYTPALTLPQVVGLVNHAVFHFASNAFSSSFALATAS